MFKGELYISQDHMLKEYIDLDLKTYSSEEEWEKAIDIFVSRINGRYFNAIEKLSDCKKEIVKYAFSIMSIECLLIDTLVKFRYGPNQVLTFAQLKRNMRNYSTYKKYMERKIKSRGLNEEKKILIYFDRSTARFSKFLTKAFPNDFPNENIARRFYEDIRCGVVHFGATENTSRLICDATELVTILENEDISIDVCIMYEKLKAYFLEYIEELKDINKKVLRRNFILGMNYLCGICEIDSIETL